MNDFELRSFILTFSLDKKCTLIFFSFTPSDRFVLRIPSAVVADNIQTVSPAKE